MRSKRKSSIWTGIFLDCPCGAKAAVLETPSRFFAHCPACGRLFFWTNPQLAERAMAGAKLCPKK